jgi:hypothetical protein
MAPVAYYIPLRDDFKEGDPILVDLNPDGSANLSRLPEDIRKELEDFGYPNPLHTKDLMPSDGIPFINALLESTNPYFRFRKTRDPES